MMASILDYDDYRMFLKDYYQEQKAKEKKYSYRKFSEDLGFSASNYLHLVITGKRNLSLDAINKIKNQFGWTAQQKKFFHNLVHYNQCKNQEEKEKYKIEMEKVLGKKRLILNPDQFAYFSTWYIPVLKEIVALKGFVSNLNWISKKLKPVVEEEYVKKGLAILERLKMIKRIKGKWLQTDEHISTEIEVTSTMVHNYHKQMLKLSFQALDMEAGDRDISAMTMSLSEEQMKWLKQRVIDFRDEIQQELQGMSSEDTMVAQLNMQLFPVTEE